MEKMNRPAPYVDKSVNRYAASQAQQMSAHRMQQNAQMNDFSGQRHFPSRADGRHTNPQIELHPTPPHSYSQGRKGNATQERTVNQNVSFENQANSDPYEQDMEIGYEDNKPTELTFDGLEQKFQDDIMILIKELSDVEDAENARHKERIIVINTRYQEKLSSLRVQHAMQIGEFLRNESHTRLHQYQQARTGTHLAERGPTDPHGYGWVAPYGTARSAPDEPYRDQARYRGATRSDGPEVRVPYPHGRVYNNSGARHY